MVLAALLTADYPAPASVWQDDSPPTMMLLLTLGEGVTIHGHPTSDDPLVNQPDWHLQARCFSAGAAVFFGDELTDGHPIMRPKVLDRARAICRGCPVAHTCLTWALTHDERYGVWAGTSGRDRAKMQLRARAGEPVESMVEKWLATL